MNLTQDEIRNLLKDIKKNQSILLNIAAFDFPFMFESLINHPNVDINCELEHHASILFKCADYHRVVLTFAQLMKHPKLNLKKQDSNGNTILHKIIEEYYYDTYNTDWDSMLNMVLSHSDLNAIIDVPNNNNLKPINISEDSESTEYLLSHGCSIEHDDLYCDNNDEESQILIRQHYIQNILKLLPGNIHYQFGNLNLSSDIINYILLPFL